MSKYEPLWKSIGQRQDKSFVLTFDEIEMLAGIPIDHSFLSCKKELAAYGYQVKKISMKDRKVFFVRTDPKEQ